MFASKMNIIGMIALCKKEVKRFLKVYHQTLFTPVVTALLFLAVFVLAMGKHISYVSNLPFVEYMSSGLLMMTMIQAAFANTSSVLIMGKVLGTIIDYLMPPFSTFELIFCLVFGAVVRALMVGGLLAICISAFVIFPVHSWALLVFYALFASILLALLGIVSALLAENFDQMAAITNYIVTPLSFLSGTFYSIHALPPSLHFLAHLNPFFYMIDGFRYSLTGYHDASIAIGVATLTASVVAMWTLTHLILASGYRIKA
jgi:ABC-2 type transport system permease protein